MTPSLRPAGMLRRLPHALLGLLVALGCAGPAMAAITDESQVPAYVLPDPLRCSDGSAVTDAADWRARRRPELLELFTRHMYGRAPGRPALMRVTRLATDGVALDGATIRRQVRLAFTADDGGPHLDLLIYLPNQPKRPLPVILGLNFDGNHTVHADPGIRLPTGWVPARKTGVVDNRATEAGRGADAGRWAITTILAQGYALATCYAGDLAPDAEGHAGEGIQALHPELQGRGDNFAAVAAWAWGLSRALDYCLTDGDLDAKRVAVFGFSRLGKAALWAGAQDERFALVLSNESGEGGAALARRHFGENLSDLTQRFPHWFCANYRAFNDREAELPFDQHELIALVAPRPVYIASAVDDRWSDPRGEFLAAKAADPVYRLLAKDGLPAQDWPPVDSPVTEGRIAYHVRSGGHDVTEYDWRQFLRFANRFLKNP
jgi:hypothetical protein